MPVTKVYVINQTYGCAAGHPNARFMAALRANPAVEVVAEKNANNLPHFHYTDPHWECIDFNRRESNRYFSVHLSCYSGHVCEAADKDAIPLLLGDRNHEDSAPFAWVVETTFNEKPAILTEDHHFDACAPDFNGTAFWNYAITMRVIDPQQLQLLGPTFQVHAFNYLFYELPMPLSVQAAVAQHFKANPFGIQEVSPELMRALIAGYKELLPRTAPGKAESTLQMIFDVGKLQLLQFLWLRLVGVEIHRYALPDEYLPGKLLLSFDSDISLNRELASLNTGHQARNRGIIKRNQIVAVHVCELAHPDNTYSPKAIANYIVNMTK